MFMEPSLVVGIVGALIILIAFFLNEIHKISEDDFTYDILNIVGAGLLAVYAYMLGSTPFLVLNIVWFLIALRDVILDIRKR
jgi:ABC-type amino acid transport system permease subunit